MRAGCTGRCVTRLELRVTDWEKEKGVVVEVPAEACDCPPETPTP